MADEGGGVYLDVFSLGRCGREGAAVCTEWRLYVTLFDARGRLRIAHLFDDLWAKPQAIALFVLQCTAIVFACQCEGSKNCH